MILRRWTLACTLVAACFSTASASTILPFGATWRSGIFDQATAPLPEGVMPGFDEGTLPLLAHLPRGVNPCTPDPTWPFAGWLVARTHVNLPALPTAVTVRWCGSGNVHFFLNGVNVFTFSQSGMENTQSTSFTTEYFVTGDNLLALYASEYTQHGDRLGFDLSLDLDFPTTAKRSTWGKVKSIYR